MELIDKILLEWSYRCEKGYPDLNNKKDIALFESLFEIDLKEEITTKTNIAAAQDFVNSSAAKANNITKFISNKYYKK